MLLQVGSSWTGMFSLPCPLSLLFGPRVLLQSTQRQRQHKSVPGVRQSVQQALLAAVLTCLSITL